MKGMRLRDQEIITTRVIEELSEIGLNRTKKFIRDKKKKELTQFQKEHRALVRLQDKIMSLNDELKRREKNLSEDIHSFNVRNFKNCNSSMNTYSNKCITQEGLEYSFSSDWEYINGERVEIPRGIQVVWKGQNNLKVLIRDELALETMGGDFNAKELISDLVKRFS